MLATTLDETAGDTLSMTFNFGYLVATAVFASVLAVLVSWQVAAPRFHAAPYWSTIVTSTTPGTTMAAYATRSMGNGAHRDAEHLPGEHPSCAS